MGQDTEELKREIENTRTDMSGTLDAIGDRVMPGRVVQRNKNKIVVGAQTLRERVMGPAHHAADTITGTVTGAGHSVADTASHATDTVKHAPDQMIERAQGAPMVAGAIAFGIGFLVAAAFPPSKSEKAASMKVMDSIEPVKEQLTTTAHEMADHLKQPATEAAQAVKTAATDSAHAVTASVTDATQQTKQQATDSLQNVKTAGPST